MITHTLVFSFPGEMSAEERDDFFSEIRQLLVERGGAAKFDHHAHLPAAEDEHAPVFVASAIAQVQFSDLDQLETASALPELESFIGRWQSRYPYKVVWANHAPVTTVTA
jgi:hypothetical protein